MKSPFLGLAVSTLAFAGSSIYLWTQLKEERARADEVTELTRRLNARIAELEAARGNIENQRLAIGAAANPATLVAGPGEVSSEVAAKQDPESKVTFEPPRPDRSPGYQKMMRAQMRANNRRMYADLGAQLGLTQEETTRLIDLISDQQLAGNMRMMDGLNNPAEMAQRWEQQERENQAQINELLGREKAEEFRKYQESMPARGEVEMIARQLEGSDAPLKDDQRKRLVAILTEERGRVPMPQYSAEGDPEAYSNAATEWQADYEQRVNAQARAILDNDQYTAYSEYQQWQKEMREHFATSRRNMTRGAGPRGNVVYAAPGAVSFAVAAPVPAPAPEPEKKK